MHIWKRLAGPAMGIALSWYAFAPAAASPPESTEVARSLKLEIQETSDDANAAVTQQLLPAVQQLGSTLRSGAEQIREAKARREDTRASAAAYDETVTRQLQVAQKALLEIESQRDTVVGAIHRLRGSIERAEDEYAEKLSSYEKTVKSHRVSREKIEGRLEQVANRFAAQIRQGKQLPSDVQRQVERADREIAFLQQRETIAANAREAVERLVHSLGDRKASCLDIVEYYELEIFDRARTQAILIGDVAAAHADKIELASMLREVEDLGAAIGPLTAGIGSVVGDLEVLLSADVMAAQDSTAGPIRIPHRDAMAVLARYLPQGGGHAQAN